MHAGTSSTRKIAASLRPLLSFGWRMIVTLTICRVVFVAWQWQRVIDADMLAEVFVQGLRFDLVLLGLTLAIPVLLYPVLVSNRLLLPAWRSLLRICLPLTLLLIVFMECSTPSFVDQFDSRPNILFFEYLNHPREVAATLWAAYRLPIILAVVIVSIITWFNARQLGKLVNNVQPIGVLPAVLVTPLLLVVCFGLIRSTLDHRAVNPSTVARSNDPLVNELALNSTYTALYALYETRHEKEGGFHYADIDKREVVAQVRQDMLIPASDFVAGDLPTMHRQRPTDPTLQRKNLVIILEESLGAEFVGALGGLDLTPNLDALSADGVWFTNLYATGIRSVRGIEAVVTGFTPTPARSVVKLGRSQRNFFTLAGLLGQAGYTSSFIYGGEAQFDNMRRFFMNNGFDRVIDEADYEDPAFVGSWGVSDEDLFARAHREFSTAHDWPFFSLVFTSSNHSPFEFPDDRIELYEQPKATVNNAVKYADHALGRFIRTAQQSDYWEDTVFLIVADHNSRVYGADVVPVDRFHIPGLILGGSITPTVFGPVASQIDLAPTLLSLIGVAATHPMIGRDLTRPGMSTMVGRAIMQFNGTQAYMEGNRVAVMQKNLPVQQYLFGDGRLVAAEVTDGDLASRALAHSAWSSMAYEESLYRLPSSDEQGLASNSVVTSLQAGLHGRALH
jgi:phosphoglycerol transferase MdoB-like AlkP superfamily enzyme